ncbi:MAG: catechol 2,3-dioxygenase [Oricola sp.]|jgi:catechol 2,3-dioxygenase|uniref:Metapyrocatechase n=1 Tax=Hyphococcus luteus TaxID=2058213 RepID=A0A2S7K1G9_9PROT|nr:catechol 2,3-dioxygenase [Marinicaulis flavus]MCK5746058.1 catechol 2,3-dioxygenase [Oricola sp.]PQA86268.1 catechol 2,3-dioxygenase [Marinicaulis flavus]
MAVTGVLRPGFIQIRVMDLGEGIVHYRDNLGLDLVSQDGEVAFLKAYDEFDRHSVVLRQADEAGLDVLGFKVLTEEALTVFAKRLKGIGVETAIVPAGAYPGVGRRVRFSIPTGHTIELYSEMELSGNGPQTKNPDIWRHEPRGMRISRFDHCAVLGVDIAASAEIFEKALDFVVTERATDPEGNAIAIFLTCSNKAHDIAFLTGPADAKLHHASFLVESWNDVGHACDLIAQRNISLDIGPTRHGITRGQTVYFFDPSGNRNECFAGGYQHYPDNPVREWTVDQMGKAIFYYEKEVHDRFTSVMT